MKAPPPWVLAGLAAGVELESGKGRLVVEGMPLVVPNVVGTWLSLGVGWVLSGRSVEVEEDELKVDEVEVDVVNVEDDEVVGAAPEVAACVDEAAACDGELDCAVGHSATIMAPLRMSPSRLFFGPMTPWHELSTAVCTLANWF